MKKTILTTYFILYAVAVIYAQDYTTPNTGVIYTLDDIAAESPTTITVSGSNYTLLGNLIISSNDALIIDTDLTLSIDAGLLVTVFGGFTVNSTNVTITALDVTAPYEGFRFEEFSGIYIRNATIEFGGGLRVLTDSFNINNSLITNNVAGATTSAVIQLSRGMPQIINNTISFNELPAIGSAANSQVSGRIAGNLIQGNNQSNSNRPQINLGTTMATETLEIINNQIIGDVTKNQVGGIAVANFTGGAILADISDNVIRDNRYGITILGGNAEVDITYNIIEDNNTQGDPLLGGSGINLNSSTLGNNIVIIGNEVLQKPIWETIQQQVQDIIFFLKTETVDRSTRFTTILQT